MSVFEQMLDTLEETEQALRVLDLQWLMSGPRGRRIVRRLLDDSQALTDPSFSFNALEVQRALGFQQFGRNLFAEVIAHCPNEFLQMQRERNAAE